MSNRLLKDVSDIMKAPLTSNGIYYIHSEQNIYESYAMIIGPTDTPYAHGCYFFKFTFPTNYPFTPPTVYFCTNNGSTRFHPNLYRNGKVCLSILNTWRGEQWTSCQTIRSVLLTLITLFIKNPLTNEPGYTHTHKLCTPYKQCVEYMNYYTAIYGMITQTHLKGSFISFLPYIIQHLSNHKHEIIHNLNHLEQSSINNTIVRVPTYNMTHTLEYTLLTSKIKQAFETFLT
jgi:ubiquitin-protein ligase